MEIPPLESWWATTIFLLGGVILLYVYLTRTHDYWRKRGVPYVKPLPLFGNLMDTMLARKPLGIVFQDLYWKLDGYKYGGVFMSGQPVLLIRDLEMIKSVLVKDFYSFHNNGVVLSHEVDPLFGRNPFVLTDERWKKTRSQLTPAFSSVKIRSYFPLITEVCEDLKRCIENSNKTTTELDVKELCARFTADVVASCAYGIRGHALLDSDSEFHRMGREILDPTLWNNFKILMVLMLPRVAQILGLSLGTPKVHKFFQRIVREVITYRENNNITQADYLQHLITLSKKGSTADDKDVSNNDQYQGSTPQLNRFTEEDIVAQTATFFVDGYETSSLAMSFALYCLALNPDVQKKVREEVDSVLKKHGGEITFEGVQEMTYLDMALSESLRMYPTNPVFLRVCTKPFELSTPSGGTYEVEVGTPVLVPAYAVHYDPQYYPDPDCYNPERFSEENKKARHRQSYLSFSCGPRICLGFRFAVRQVKAGIATILHNYEVLPSKRTPIPIVPDPNHFMLAAKGGIWLDLVKRTDI